MAIQIRETPIIEGKDAKIFLDHLECVINRVPTEAEIRAKEAELEKLRTSYDRLKHIMNGAI